MTDMRATREELRHPHNEGRGVGSVSRRTFLGSAAASLGTLLVSCGRKTPSDARPNVVLIIVDALRYDRIEAERNGIPVMPALREFHSRARWFANAAVASSWTKPSMVSMFTSLHMPAHGVEYSSTATEIPVARRFVPTALKLLPEYLEEAGYFTMGVQTNPHLTDEMGFGQGMQDYRYLPLSPAHRVTRETNALLDAHGKDGPFFLYVHYIDPHEPYWPPDRYKQLLGAEDGVAHDALSRVTPDAFREYFHDDRAYQTGWKQERDIEPLTAVEREVIRAYYDGETRYADDELATLLQAIERDFPNTLFCITSDHGEEFWEHGSTGHGHTLYEELLHVPLAIGGPGIEPGITSAPALGVDIVPTIAAYVGIPPSDIWQGRNLLEEPNAADRPVFAHTRGALPVELVDLDAVRRGFWKLVVDRRSGEKRLFDIEQDPLEQQDVLRANVEIADALGNTLGAHYEECHALHSRLEISDDSQPKELSDEILEQMRDLGYLQ